MATEEPQVAPFWYGFQWEPIPFAELPVWDNLSTRKLNEMIKEHRDKLAKLPQRYIPYLLGLRGNITRLIAERLSAPHHRVLKRHYERLIREIDGRLNELYTYKDLVSFEDDIQPYILAHAHVEEQSRTASAGGPAATSTLGNIVEQQTKNRITAKLIRDRMMCQAAEFSEAKADGQTASNSLTSQDVIHDMLSKLWSTNNAPNQRLTARHDICTACEVPLHKSTRDQMLVCPKCGFSMTYLDATEAARTYGDEVEFTTGPYHRFNHWQEYLTRSQAREMKTVPPAVLEKVAMHIHREMGITRGQDITQAQVAIALHVLNMKEYKIHATQITARLSGRWPRQMTMEQVFIAKHMFFEILQAYEHLFPGDKLFRNKYCMVVICNTMGWMDMLKSFPLLTGRDEVEDNERRMRVVFNHLGWVYKELPFSIHEDTMDVVAVDE